MLPRVRRIGLALRWKPLTLSGSEVPNSTRFQLAHGGPPRLVVVGCLSRACREIASWCNGSTSDSGSLCHGSNPCEAAIRRASSLLMVNRSVLSAKTNLSAPAVHQRRVECPTSRGLTFDWRVAKQTRPDTRKDLSEKRSLLKLATCAASH